jgi:hypothetical protein
MSSKNQKIFVVLCRRRDYLFQAQIRLKITEFIQNHFFNMISDVPCNITANKRDMHKRPFLGRSVSVTYHHSSELCRVASADSLASAHCVKVLETGNI